MPINYQQAQEQIQAMGRNAKARSEQRRSLLEHARALLRKFAEDPQPLQEKFDRALAHNPHLRCAQLPVERLDARCAAPANCPPCVLLAADGSQIAPDRQAAMEYGVINVGTIRIQAGGTPQAATTSILLFDDALRTAGGLLTDDMVALMRDLEERRMLAELAKKETLPVVTLTDGPLELYAEARETPEFRQALESYRRVLDQLAERRAAVAGYVDKPLSDLLVRLLELDDLKENEFDQAGRLHPLAGISDILLLGDLLAPGERSAVFAIQSDAPSGFRGQQALHFFYLNVGRQSKPWLVRVEAPRWVVEAPDLLELLHASLLAQAQQLGVKPYPYILARAHEIAVVKYEEREALENMIAAELRRQGVEVGEQAYKREAKETGSPTRYSR